jgi:hypothetical protein
VAARHSRGSSIRCPKRRPGRPSDARSRRAGTFRPGRRVVAATDARAADRITRLPCRPDARQCLCCRNSPLLARTAHAALAPAYAGIRPKIAGCSEPPGDFLIQGPAQHGIPGLINLFGIESPGLTASWPSPTTSLISRQNCSRLKKCAQSSTPTSCSICCTSPTRRRKRCSARSCAAPCTALPIALACPNWNASVPTRSSDSTPLRKGHYWSATAVSPAPAIATRSKITPCLAAATDDQKFLILALRCRADLLITRDRLLLQLARHRRLPVPYAIVTAAAASGAMLLN